MSDFLRFIFVEPFELISASTFLLTPFDSMVEASASTASSEVDVCIVTDLWKAMTFSVYAR